MSDNNTEEIHRNTTDIAVVSTEVKNLAKTVDANHIATMKGQEEIKELFQTEVFPRMRKLEIRQTWMMGFAAGFGFLGNRIYEWFTGSSHH